MKTLSVENIILFHACWPLKRIGLKRTTW